MRFMIYDFKKKESLYCGWDRYINQATCKCGCLKCDYLVIKKDDN